MYEFSVLSLIIYGVFGAIIYNFISNNYKVTFLTFYSLFIYCIWSFDSIGVLLLDMLVGWIVAISVSKNKCHKRVILCIGIVFITFIFAINRYAIYLYKADNNNSTRIISALGISYYSFKIISYMVDCYRGKVQSIQFIDYIMYVACFLEIVSGPISRYEEIDRVRNVNISYIENAIYRIVRGLFYKLVIADRLATYVTKVFDGYMDYTSLALWMAAVFYSIQLYADFAGYSDIVIGLGLLYGFEIKENFCIPYFSKNIKEFWTRWHISLSSWLRDYIYIPLGGNRRGKNRQRINILITFIVSGIWHGASLPYIIWGLWHGIWHIIFPDLGEKKFNKIVSIMLNYIIVMFGWICFRVNTIKDLLVYIKSMFCQWDLTMNGIISSVMPFSGDYSCVAKLLTACLVIVVMLVLEYREWKGCKISNFSRGIVFVVCIVFLGMYGQDSFIYANY